MSTPGDLNTSFEPQLIKKNQTRFTSMDSKILYLYSKGMSTRDITATFKEMYDAGVSATLIFVLLMPYWMKLFNGSHDL